MLKDDDAVEPLTVYVNTPGTGEAKARREAVNTFLLDEGLLASQIQVKEGANPGSVSPAAKGLKAFAITDGQGAGVVGAPTPVSSPAPGSGSPK